MTATALMTRVNDMSMTNDNTMSFTTLTIPGHVNDTTQPSDNDSDNSQRHVTNDSDKVSLSLGSDVTPVSHDNVKDKKRRDKKLRRDADALARAVATTVNSSVIGYVAVLGGLVTVAVVNFCLSFIGLYDYGTRVAKLPYLLPALIPVGIDGLAVCAIGAIYLLRHAPLRIRFFCWIVFLTPTTLSVLGNIAHALAADLSTSGIAGSAAWPILLALSTHLGVVAMRNLERARLHAEQHLSDNHVNDTNVNVNDNSDRSGVTKNDNDTRGDPVTRVNDNSGVTSSVHVTNDKTAVTHVNDTAVKNDKPSVTYPRVKRVNHVNGSDKDYAQKRHQQGATVTQIVTELVTQNGYDNSDKTVSRLRRNIYRWTK